ncbi:hypothetical protein IV203_025503 [Nitzschia inconspicua]|uniref:Uncharacterized protein n=1 Tax=Nitzschia inconspicua TaxID=303405 RepID=A0A9K3KAN9_9STRA|nr:hypothetical protein IV203_028280 [Nitzschia inconspicua]KAG7362619.1 hypothetical protein IV203_025503 [Nitzschia inconspicua]
MRSTKIQDEWPWIVNSDPCCWKMDVPPKAVLSLFFHHLMVPLGLSGRNNRLSKESHHLDVKRSCVLCSMSKIFNLTVRSKVTTSVEKTKATALGATIILQQQESVQRQSKKQYTMMCLIYLQALQLGRRLGASYLMCIDSLWDGLLYLERPTGMTREQMGIVLYQYTQTRRMRQQQQQQQH